MKKLYFLTMALLVFFVSACADSTGSVGGGQRTSGHLYVRIHYNECDPAEVADFALTCIENANPKSDEEPEDWIDKCQNMAMNLLCKEDPHFYYSKNRRMTPDIPCTEAVYDIERKICGEDLKEKLQTLENVVE